MQIFLKSFQRWKIENVQQQRNALCNRLFDGQLQFHVPEEPQIDPKRVEKNITSVLTIW